MVRLLSSLLFCDLDDLPNVLRHIWVGIGNVALPVALHFALPTVFTPLGAVLFGLLFGWGFIKYQKIEQIFVSDRAYPELKGWLWGIILCSFGMAIIKIILLLVL